MTITERTPIPSLDATIERFLQTFALEDRPTLHTLASEDARAVLAGIQTGERYTRSSCSKREWR